MVDRPIPPALVPLVRYLENLTERATVEQLHEVLGSLQLTRADVADYIIFDDKNYRRNLVCEGPWYQMLVICWKSGQRSPIHNHTGSTCGMWILHGNATETLFEHTACGQVKATRSFDRHEGEVTASADTDTHQISNLQGPGQNLITLHIYSPALRTMDLFSIMGDKVGVYQPTVFEFAHGGGI